MATKITTGLLTDNAVTDAKLSATITATTQSASDNSTSVATTAYVTTAIANLADSAPSTLNTLNELAAALGDDANFSTTVTNSIAGKLPLAGGTMTGALTVIGNIEASGTKNITAQFDSGDYMQIGANNSGGFAKGVSNSVTNFMLRTYGDSFILNNNLGIGNTTPQAKLHVTDGATILDMTDNGYGGLKITDDSSSDYNVNFITGRNQGNTRFNFYRSGRAQGTTPWSDTTPTKIAHFSTNSNYFVGSVGIGTDSPAQALHVDGIVASQNSSQGSGLLQLQGYGNTAYINHTGSDKLYFRMGSGFDTRMTLTTGGNLGIGQSSPTGKLEITATGTNAAPHIKLTESGDSREFNIYNDGSGNGRLVLADSTDDTPDTEIVLADNGFIQFKTANTERMSVNDAGALLINTTQEFDSLNGRGNLVVGSGSGNEGITIYSGSDSQGGIIFADGNSGTAAYPGQIQYTHSDNSMRFYVTDGTEKLRIEGSYFLVKAREKYIVDGATYGKVIIRWGASASGDRLSAITADLNSLLGLATNQYGTWEVSFGGYGGSGTNGCTGSFTMGGYTGHSYSATNHNSYGAGTINVGYSSSGGASTGAGPLSYHPVQNNGMYIMNGEVWVYNPSAQQIGIMIKNNGSQSMYGTMTVIGTIR